MSRKRHEEYELRFGFDPRESERIVSHALLRPALRDRQVSHQVSTYFDTPNNVLQRHRFGLRVRRSDHTIVHTLKRTNGSLISRGEWERAHEASEPDLAWLRRTPLASLLREEEVASELGPRFSTDVTRTTLPLRHRKAAIEAAIDQGTVSAAGVALTLNELELELKRGRKTAVLDLARKLARDLPLVLTLASKAERGYGLSDLTWGRPVEEIAPAVRRGMTIAEAFESITQSCLDAFLRNAALIEADEDGVALHKARIALRHLRAACQLFAPVLRRKRFASLRRQIKWLSDKLGSARDADVFQAAFYDPAARDGGIPGAKALATLMSEHRRAAHGRLRAALSSPRARVLFVDLLAFSRDAIRRRWRRDESRPFVRKALDRHRRLLARRAKRLARLSIPEVHDVRKSAKMLRYDLDLFAGVPKLGKGRRVRRLGANLKVLQQTLGAFNDEVAMRTHLRETVLARTSAEELPSGEAGRAVLAAAQLCASRPDSDPRLQQAEAAARRL